MLDACVAAGPSLPRIGFDCGRTDPLIEPNRALHAGLDAAGIEHRYQEFDGGHEWPYGAEHLTDAMAFLRE